MTPNKLEHFIEWLKGFKKNHKPARKSVYFEDGE